ncbi:hypothetical protein F5B20DRAFT_541622 [Whalleya microplaca]|nr:hypothetical protein F5B20DRAFT_541622 [Whalleya microplaca]
MPHTVPVLFTMDWYRGLTATVPGTVKSEGKKLRRKLQKIGSQQRSHKPDYDDVQKYSKPTQEHLKTSSTVRALPEKQAPPLARPVRHNVRWSEQYEKGDLYHDFLATRPKKPFRHSVNIVPEFAHLTINDASPRLPLSRGSDCPSVAHTSTSSLTRRYAKTPVLHIGQLEEASARDEIAARRMSSVEIIAESYRALLESRCALLNDEVPESPGGHYITDTRTYPIPEYPQFEDTPRKFPESPRMIESPNSDDGTLVAYDEDVCFKPAPLPHEPVSPLRISGSEQPTPPIISSSPEDPSLPLCFDLLTRELSSAVSGSPLQPSNETSALQIWVMIEAYEKLRDGVQGLSLENDQKRSMEASFNMWLKALYAVHGKLTGNDGQMSESDYGQQDSDY